MRLVVNRLLLALVGALLMAAGGAALTAGSGGFGRAGSHRPLLGTAVGARWAPTSWWWWLAVLAGLVVLLALALWWLLAQGRRGRLRRLLVDSQGAAGVTAVGAGALSDALVTQAEALAGVRGIRARLVGTSGNPRIRLAVTMAPSAEPAELLEQIAQQLEQARESLDLDWLTAEVVLHAQSRGGDRLR
jgi:hypothetical protein